MHDALLYAIIRSTEVYNTCGVLTHHDRTELFRFLVVYMSEYMYVTAEMEAPKNPPVGEDGNPPVGEDGNPPVGEHGNPPVGEDGNPPVGEHGNPPVGEWEPPGRRRW